MVQPVKNMFLVQQKAIEVVTHTTQTATNFSKCCVVLCLAVICSISKSGGEGSRPENKDASHKVPHNIL
jgi:hypothetical protein